MIEFLSDNILYVSLYLCGGIALSLCIAVGFKICALKGDKRSLDEETVFKLFLTCLFWPIPVAILFILLLYVIGNSFLDFIAKKLAGVPK